MDEQPLILSLSKYKKKTKSIKKVTPASNKNYLKNDKIILNLFQKDTQASNIKTLLLKNNSKNSGITVAFKKSHTNKLQ